MKNEFISTSPADTENIAAELADGLSGGEVIAFYGDLGMGKTHFVKGLAKALEYSGDVTSPTFNLVNEYRGGRLDIFHFDMYRVSSWEDLYSTGFFEYMDENGVIAVEWSENIESAIPDTAIRVTIKRIDDTKRKIIIERQ